MQLKSAPTRRGLSPTGSRIKKKKHKRLDSISETFYNQSRSEFLGGKGGSTAGAEFLAANSELRRSSRVRRAPDLLDASPPPVKKRRKVDNKNVKAGVNDRNDRSGLGTVKKEESERLEDFDTPGSWRSRLRSRDRDVRLREKRGRASRKRRLFDDVEGVKSEFNEKKAELNGGKLVAKSKRKERVKAVNILESEEEEGDENDDGLENLSEKVKAEMGIGNDVSGIDEADPIGNKADDGTLDGKMGEESKGEVGGSDVLCLPLDEGLAKERVDGLGCENRFDLNENVENVEQSNDEVDLIESQKETGNEMRESGELKRCEGEENNGEELESRKDVENEEYRGGEEKMELASGEGGENVTNVVEVAVAFPNEVKGGEHCDKERGEAMEVDEIPMEGDEDAKVDKTKHDSGGTLARPRIKQGRRCGLCGCGNDGKPPKRLMQDADVSEIETCSGSSASEEPNYDIWDGFGDEPEWLGRLLGPINDRYGIAGIWVHQHCAVWSPEVYFAGLGCLKNVRAALCRGRALKCSRCGRPGATIGCRVDRCPKTYHLPCARAKGCIFDHRKFLIACTDHRHLFQPHGNKYFMRIKKLKAKKMKLEMRKVSNDAWRKDVEAEEKWLENCGEDEEFLKRESRRLHRDLLRIAPVYIGGPDSESGKFFEGWESVAGLQDVIRCMKEVVFLPLLYPEFFSSLGITPPRGVLLHGYPGTGKTLVVRALIGSCARSDKRIAYFARKGADCLGKYVGDAERQLRLLFQVAERCQPSIIFFDEIDGLAPCRTRQQDQTHSSVVSTLLALMDGLKSRGSVVVIGATNRPEAVDPALRRPGRFDREIYFPLPSLEDRAAILSLHTRRWPKPVAGSLLKWIARRTVGFAGADLQALCTQAAIIALKRNFPLHEVLSSAAEKGTGTKRLPLPPFTVEERDWLEVLACAPPPCSRREAGIAAYDLVSCPLPTHLIPCLLKPISTLLVSLYLDERLWLPSPISEAGAAVKSVIISSMEKNNLLTDHWWSHVDDFLGETDIAKEIQRRLLCAGILVGDTSCAANDAANDDNLSSEPSCGMHNILCRRISFPPRKNSGFRVLIAGSPRSGQRHLASCILHCFAGNLEIQKVDLATVSQEGHGDMVQGITQILMKCAGLQSCLIFMPRIDLWAVETCQQITDESNAPSENKEFCSTHSLIAEKEIESVVNHGVAAERTDSQGISRSASVAWSSFIELVESICVSTSLMILATSELPFPEFPDIIKQFFKSEISKSSQSNPLEHTVPRFSVHLDGNFDHDAVINLCAVELSRDIVQLYLQLIHQRAHISKTSSKENQICDSIRGGFDTELRTDNVSVTENGGRRECRPDSSIEVSPLSNRISKGKSNLLLAISTFGYQVLLYPHFAELCWVSSKLKGGPYVDVNGPWKGWPFNSCIIRPNNSLDKGIVANSSASVKSKDSSGVVRGLIAVGLLAYRGVYNSVREVSFEVRKVLELLVEQVNEKILAGKDRYRYLRLLSQVAYLEDVVNSWAYSLQSLDLDPLMKVANSKSSPSDLSDKHICVDTTRQGEERERKASIRSSDNSKWQDGGSDNFATENLEGVELNKGDNDFCDPNPEGRDGVSEIEPAQQVGCDNPEKDLQNCNADIQLVESVQNEQNEINPGQINSEITDNLVVIDENSESSKHLNGSTFTEPVHALENGFPSAGGLGACEFSVPQKLGNKMNGLTASVDRTHLDNAELDHHEHAEVMFSPSKTPSLSACSAVECSYHCCLGCLNALYGMIKKILIRCWELNKGCWTAEDIHDMVATLSTDLLTAISKLDLTGNISNSSDQEPRHGNPEQLSECPKLHKCHCTSSRNSSLVSMECGCHTSDECVTAKANNSNSTEVNSYPNSHFRLDPVYVFRDGVLVPLESNRDVSFHCKYDTLCLCSLIESIEMMKQPFD